MRRIHPPIRRLSLIVLVCSIGCRHDATAPRLSPYPSYVHLQSDAGDPIGGGSNYSYTPATAQFAFFVSAGHLSVTVDGDEHWTANFVLPNGASRLTAGTYSGLGLFPSANPAAGSMKWTGQAWSCSAVTGTLTIDSVAYRDPAVFGVEQLTALDAHFDQHCDGNAAALHGSFHWLWDDPTRPSGPVLPIPSGLWAQPAGAIPATGNSIYLESEPGDVIGAGTTVTYTDANAPIFVNASGNRVEFLVSTAQPSYGDFQAMMIITQLQPGYYADLRGYPHHNPTKGGLNWSARSILCSSITGWFAVDQVSYTAGGLTALDLRFEQHCNGAAAALHGAIHWRG
jgi:hypothetical protein